MGNLCSGGSDDKDAKVDVSPFFYSFFASPQPLLPGSRGHRSGFRGERSIRWPLRKKNFLTQ